MCIVTCVLYWKCNALIPYSNNKTAATTEISTLGICQMLWKQWMAGNTMVNEKCNANLPYRGVDLCMQFAINNIDCCVSSFGKCFACTLLLDSLRFRIKCIAIDWAILWNWSNSVWAQMKVRNGKLQWMGVCVRKNRKEKQQKCSYLRDPWPSYCFMLIFI